MIEKRHYTDAPPVNFDAMPELAAYCNQPPAMYVGCPGKHGFLDLGFEVDGSGRSIMRDHNRRAPLIVQKELYFDEEMPDLPCVYILSSGGPNVDGDRYEQIFRLKKDSMAFISTGAATKLAEMRHNYSGMRQTIILEAGAYLEYLPLPIIPCRHARYISDTRIVIDETAAMFYSEIYMPGRKYYGSGEKFVYDLLSIASHAERPDGRQLYREKFIIRPEGGNLQDVGLMGVYDVFGNVITLAPKDAIEEIYSRTEPFADPQKKLACGVSRLSNECGLIFKALGLEPDPVKKLIRSFCSTVRETVKGKPLPAEFPWR